jgi:hypothetical protein
VRGGELKPGIEVDCAHGVLPAFSLRAPYALLRCRARFLSRYSRTYLHLRRVCVPLARKANAIVVSVDYPLAPEHTFPAVHDEAIEAYRYILKNAKSWGGDPAKIAIVGESTGGNLAINTAIAARDQKPTAPVAVISVYWQSSRRLRQSAASREAHSGRSGKKDCRSRTCECIPIPALPAALILRLSCPTRGRF